MSNDQKRKAKKKKESLAQKRRQSDQQTKFIDGMDSYTDEYLRVLTKPPVYGLHGAFTIQESDYYSFSNEQLFARVGLADHRYLTWDTDHEATQRVTGENIKAAGKACAVMTSTGRVLPVIFLRDTVTVDTPDFEHAEELKDGIRLIVLLHELGHAEDMLKEVNFDHKRGTVDRVSAEAYAHTFVIKHLQKRNCRLALKHYISQLDEWNESSNSADDYVKLAARRVLNMPNMSVIREFSNRTFDDIAWQKEVVRTRIQAKLRCEGTT